MEHEARTTLRHAEELPLPSRAERRRIASAARKGVVIPDALDTRRPGWDHRVLNVIDKVFVNGVCPGACEAYSVKGGWAKYQGIPEPVYGLISFTRK